MHSATNILALSTMINVPYQSLAVFQNILYIFLVQGMFQRALLLSKKYAFR